MLLLTLAMVATAATAPDAIVEKKLPLVKEIQLEEVVVAEESNDVVANDIDLQIVAEDVDASEEE